jgi:hypothetical protein
MVDDVSQPSSREPRDDVCDSFYREVEELKKENEGSTT